MDSAASTGSVISDEIANTTQNDPSVPRADIATNWPSLGAVAGPIILAIGWSILGALHPGYSPKRQLISVLGIIQGGWVLDTIFVLNGLLILIGIFGTVRSMRSEVGTNSRRIIAILLALSALGVLWDGIFNMNDLILHTIGTQFACGLPIITFPIIGLMLRRAPAWRRVGNWFILSGPLSLMLIIGFSSSIPLNELSTLQGATKGGGYLGLWERALVTEVQVWYVILGWMAFRRSRDAASTQ